MERKIVAISGRENGRPLGNGQFALYETEPMDMEIIKLTNKDKPNFLFMVHAQSSLEIQESYYQTMKKIYGDKFNCNCDVLKSNELEDIEKVKEKIKWADIIYEGGGNTLKMINLWKDTGFDKILYDAWNDGKVICGISAGAVCWFKSCNSDSTEEFESIDCLNWIDLYFTPHCDEPGRYESTKEQLKENGMIGILLSNCAAIEIIDDKYRIIISDAKGHDIDEAYALKAYWDDGEYKEEKILVSNEYQNMNGLLKR